MNLAGELVGVIAGTLTTGSFLPQTIKMLKSPSAEGVSLLAYCCFSLGVVFWIGYGILYQSPSIIAFNAVSLVLNITIIVLKVRSMRRAAP